jgi:hypothetical protein
LWGQENACVLASCVRVGKAANRQLIDAHTGLAGEKLFAFVAPRD